ncbi:MAG TPA: transcription termination factor NusA [SAR86 cluster bacterium]|jgi:N utilization substance protein A|nr:transcription termination factor NusA [SAR86 cluster bacterium]HJM15403.1 transcription termination factor NusA [SAR86 cluster bacterium]|tara:strand:+ start:504 stop:1976 length:1473 start_codon:yes stop_codon:yes gene_type:complete
MQNEILLVAEAVSGEKGLPKSTIFEAIEMALATATKRRYEENSNIEVKIDSVTGDYVTFRVWTIVSDEELEDNGIEIVLSEAKAKDKDLDIGSVIKEKIENVEFGRIAAQAAKQVIVQKVREAERAQVVEKYRSVLGELVNGTVKKVTREFLIIDLGDGAEAILSRNELIPGEVFRIGDRLRAVLQEEERENRGPQLALSRRCPEMVGELFKLEVPEISEQVIEIKAIARDAGSRTKIAVKTNDNRIDPVGACVGMRGSRVQAVSNELGNERLDIVIWDDDPAQLLINSMGPAEITSIVLDEVKGTMDVAVTQDTLAQAIGKSGQNVRLSSQITGWKLNVIDEETAQSNEEEKSQSESKNLIENLDVDEGLAQALIEQGYRNLESISSALAEDLVDIEGLDSEIAELLINRAKEVLLTLAMQITDEEGEPNDLMSVEGMDMVLALELSQKGINDREELAEQSIEELTGLIQISEEDAGELIMKARAHWFE